MEKSAITWERTLQVWWSFFWRFIVVSLFLGAILGYVGGILAASVGRADLSAAVGGVLGWLASIPISIWAIRRTLTKTYPGFSIRVTEPGA